MNVGALHQILDSTTRQLRKGGTVEHERIGHLEVTHVYAMQHVSEASDRWEKVDCHFVVIGVDREAAQPIEGVLRAILSEYPQPQRLAGGPSYIEVGAAIGDQGAALQLFGLGEVLGLWKVITPSSMGITGSEADDLAGRGFVMISGYQIEAKEEA